jgi:predicted nucleic acid-binding protein
MTAWYIDTSSFVKLVSVEEHSAEMEAWVADRDERADRIVSSDLLRTESRRVARRSTDPQMYALTLERLERIDLIPLSSTICDDAGIVDPSELRSLDALHIAGALALGDDLSGIVTYDRRMIEAAESYGITAASPGATR